MRHLLLVPLLAFSAVAQAQDGLPAHQVKHILEGPALTADEQTKIRFDAAVAPGDNPPTFNFRLYNGLRDKTIVGLVVTVSSTDAKGKAEETDTFVSVDLEPLNSTQGSAGYFLNFGNAPTKATFTLKQVLYQADPGAKPKS